MPKLVSLDPAVDVIIKPIRKVDDNPQKKMFVRKDGVLILMYVQKKCAKSR